MSVSDLDAAIDWFEKVLGFELDRKEDFLAHARASTSRSSRTATSPSSCSSTIWRSRPPGAERAERGHPHAGEQAHVLPDPDMDAMWSACGRTR